MSRFESSRFVRNPQVMHVDVLKSACDALGWQYTIQDNILTVSDAKQKSRLYGEFALKLNLKQMKSLTTRIICLMPPKRY